MSEDREELPDELLSTLGDELTRIRRRSFASAGRRLEVSAFRILRIVETRGPQTLAELATALDLEQSTITRQVNAAIKRGLLTRIGARGARRVSPTPAGTEAYEHDLAAHAATFRAALHELGASRVRRLLSDLRDFNDALDRAHD